MRIRRRTRGWGWGALLAVALAPSVAQAQLFPNLPTQKRVRIDCAEELPVYGMYRQKYHGYYPTCWRQFPPGWGCPSTESPDWQAELARQPLDIPEDDFAGLDGLDPDPFGDPGTDALLPDLPRQRSPFELDEPGQGESPIESPRRSPPPFQADPFGAPGTEQPDPTSRPSSPFDLPGASSSMPGVTPSLNPPETTEPSPVSDPIVSLPQLPNLSELAVLPDARPRPIRLPSESGSAPLTNVSSISGIDGELVGSSNAPLAPLNSRPIGTISTEPYNSHPGVPGHVIQDSQGISYSQSVDGSSVPIDIEYSEPRPRRRLFSGLFGRGK